VGAKLTYPDGRLQHVGLLIGVCGVAAHAFHRHPGGATGYAGSAMVARNCSAVSAACLMMRTALFTEVGGLDEGLPVDFNDVDLCLRLRAAGYRIVFTPYAELIHHESASFGRRTQSSAELARMRERWGPVLERDPYYNPNLSTRFSDYRLEA
jgi:GT2 family glycosyltransferase